MVETSVVFHSIAAVFHIYAFFYPTLHQLPPSPIAKGFGGRLRYLTIWAHLLQVGYYVFALLLDIYAAYKGYMCRKLKGIRDSWFSILVYPLSLLVFSLFWGIYAIDRELIFPKSLDAIMPPTYNHSLHTLIIFWATAETLITDISVPEKKKGIVVVSAFTICYTAWSYVVYVNMGMWAYPFLNLLPGTHVAAFFLGTYILIGLLFLATTSVQHRFGKNIPEKIE